jgi:hypothetical protein
MNRVCKEAEDNISQGKVEAAFRTVRDYIRDAMS